eukprot:1246954-Pyramimonas_sp.AAC.1
MSVSSPDLHSCRAVPEQPDERGEPVFTINGLLDALEPEGRVAVPRGVREDHDIHHGAHDLVTVLPTRDVGREGHRVQILERGQHPPPPQQPVAVHRLVYVSHQQLVGVVHNRQVDLC